MRFKTTREILKARARLENAVRAYFNGEGFVEVTTPAALLFPNLDPNIKPVRLSVKDLSGTSSDHWLHTSPELSMKKLIAAGSGSIFQICPVFRDEEVTSTHNMEFSMLEWYRMEANYITAIKDSVNVLLAAMRAVIGTTVVTRGGNEFDLEGPWEEITMSEAFKRFAGVDAFNREDMLDALGERGKKEALDADQEEIFFRLYLQSVEPELGRYRPTVVKDFPSFLGTMAKPKDDEPEFLERFEIFIGGLELANGFSELTDPGELERRMRKVSSALEREGLSGARVDREFLEASARLGRCAGVSVGMDRLAMLAMGADKISEVIFPFRAGEGR